ncbi:MAG: type IV pilus assembly protein PilM [bacterium]|nr:type IV pilus assembly protein PilM [bacterium]
MPLFYKDQPVFGFDIGRSSIKVMGIDQTGKKPKVTGYGSITFDPSAINNGIITNPEIIIKRAYDLFTKELVGNLTTTRVGVSLPNANSFSRVMSLPKMDNKDVAAAIRLEAEQSIPVPIDDLYYDYNVTSVAEDGAQELQLIACQKDIIDSYLGVFDALGLEVALVESNISAVSRMVAHAEAHDVGTLIVDFGSTACDLSVFDYNTVRVTGTVNCSGENVTKQIANKLGLTIEQAHSVKTRYGLEKSKKQAEILDAVEPELSKLINEIKKVIRYYAERSGSDKQIGQIIVLGGGANLPGLSTYITNHTRVPARLCAPWSNLTFGRLQPPHELETTLFTTAGGLSLANPKDLRQ